MRLFNVLLSLFVVTALTLLAVEGILRLVGQGPGASPHRVDSALGWSKKADHEQVREGKHFTAHIVTNEQGLRDDPMPSTQKRPGTFRVVMLGDSFTLGYTVERDDLFVDLLERRWNAEGRRVDVVNTGTAGYSTDQEVAWLLEHGEDYAPDLVVLLPYDNDLFWNSQDRYTDFAKPRFTADGTLEPPAGAGWSLRTSTAIGRVLGKIFPKGQASMRTPGGKPVPPDFAPLFEPRPEVYADSEARTAGALMALRTECERLGARLAVAPIPSNSAVDPAFAAKFGQTVFGVDSSQWTPDAPVEFFLGAARDLGIPALDVRPELRAAQSSPDGSLYHDFFAGDQEWHFNERGNRVFADALYAKLEGLGALPPKTTELDPNAVAEVGSAGGETEEASGGIPTWMIVFGILWVALSGLYMAHYRDEPAWQPPLKIGLLLGAVFGLILGGSALLRAAGPGVSSWALPLLLLLLFGFIAYKLGNRLATIAELFKAFTLRGHWYLMPVVVVLLTIGSLLVVAASSPLVAPFIYTLF